MSATQRGPANGEHGRANAGLPRTQTRKARGGSNSVHRRHHQPADRRPAAGRGQQVRPGDHGVEARRQINAYYAQLGEGLLEYVGPLVETRVQEKPLSIALREISERLLSAELPPAES